MRGENAELGKPVGAPDFLGRRKRGQRIKMFHLAGDLGVERRCVKGTDAVNAALSGDEVLPKHVSFIPERRDDPQAGDDHPARG